MVRLRAGTHYSWALQDVLLYKCMEIHIAVEKRAYQVTIALHISLRNKF
jgi:hypothetical protein